MLSQLKPLVGFTLTPQVACKYASPPRPKTRNMRLSFLLLVAAVATLLASGDALSANPGADLSVAAEEKNTEPRQRLLRTHGHHKNKPAAEDDNDEERAHFNYTKFSKMLSDSTYRNKRFYSWRYQRKFSDEKVYALMQVDKHPLLKTLFYKYQQY